MSLIDSHCHLPNLQRKERLEQQLNDAKEAGVEGFINIGTSLKENAKAIKVADTYPEVYATVAIFPHEHLGENVENLLDALESQAGSCNKVIAIGECGIDITAWKNGRNVQEQKDLFEKQVLLSQKLNLPLIIHNRNGEDLILKILSKHKPRAGVVHCFDSSWETAQRFLDLGFYISFSGFITYQTRTALLETVRKVPRDRYLVETDSPFILPEPIRNQLAKGKTEKKNEPKYVRIVAQKVAQVQQEEHQKVAEQSRQNTCKLFGIKP